MSEKILCLDGPARDRKVKSTLGKRWPWVLSFDAKTMNYMLGYYELDEEDNVYRWNPDSVETGNFND